MQQATPSQQSKTDNSVNPLDQLESGRLTMYDLPSDFSQGPGLPDVYHDLQPQLLSATLRLTDYGFQERFTGTDLNLYYDADHPLWHKRPDWFAVMGVPYQYNNSDMRLSYVVWDEGAAPNIIIELLSPGTEKQDLGPFYRTTDTIDAEVEDIDEIDHWIETENLEQTQPKTSNGTANGHPPQKLKPPSKWKVYEEILKVPYYAVFSRYTGVLRFFRLSHSGYQEQSLDLDNPRIWLDDLQIGLGVWQGEYEGHTRKWLRWFNADGTWIATDTEQERTEKIKALEQLEQEKKLRERLLEKLKQQGIEIDLDNLESL